MSPLNSRVWRRYGQLRIYVSADNGPVGWFDPRTGRFQLSQPGLRDEFWAGVRAECQRLSAAGQIKEPAFPSEASPAAPQQPSPVMPVSQPQAGPPSFAAHSTAALPAFVRSAEKAASAVPISAFAARAFARLAASSAALDTPAPQ